ncbi:MAG: PQQ-binding-like beta-propeller repeat protein, partial [Actinobacteria bacterium]|nr:PQQ-binding-like beta-propeller repeat protein [Actinomycetota bacterium]
SATASRILETTDVTRGIYVVLGDSLCRLSRELAKQSELVIYSQFDNEQDVAAARKAVDADGFYGTRIYVEKGDLKHIHLADNMADALIALGETASIAKSEALRVIRPEGKALVGKHIWSKSFPKGIDDWSHPYHGPDNNTQSKDKVIKAPYLSQFFAEPRYAPATQVAVASGGRVFKAFGDIAFHEREEALLNTLIAFNGYNGTILWKRPLVPGIMIHRNTIIATPSTLYLADNKSCKLIDTKTGRIKDEIKPPIDIAGGTFWKWMGMENGTLYALIGEQEPRQQVMRWQRTVHGWPWTDISKGYNEKENPWGFGRNLLAIDPKKKKVLWHHHEDEPADSRSLAMKNGRIYLFRFGEYLTCLDAKSGKTIWRKTKENAPARVIQRNGRNFRQTGLCL